MKFPLSIGIFPNCLTEVLGGSERLCHELITYLTEKNHRIVLYCNNSRSETPVLPLPDSVKIKFVNPTYPSNNDVQVAKRDFVSEKLDVFLSFNSTPYQLFFATSLLGTHIPFIYSELGSPAYVERFWNATGRRAAMSGADFIHMLLTDYAESLPPHLRHRARVIPSPAPATDENILADLDARILISLGAQNHNKQVHYLIQAFERIAPDFPDWRLEIWGVGPDANIVETMARKSSACAQIQYGGFATDAMRTLARGSLYCIPSAFEGMPLTLLEAMCVGLPSVGFAGCPGVNSVIRHGENGLLAQEMNPEALAGSLASLMGNREKRINMGNRAREGARAYTPDRVFSQWEDLLYEAAALRGHTTLDRFANEPFASKATLSAAARREYILRDFGQPMPGTMAFFRLKAANICRYIRRKALGNTPSSFPVPSEPPLPSLAGMPEVEPYYRDFRARHAELARRIVRLGRVEWGKYEESGFPGEFIANGWHHSMLARYCYAASLFGPGAHVCDLGAGFGWGGAILAQNAASVVCVERNSACMRTAKELWPDMPLDWRREDILDFLVATPDAAFDGISCMEVIEHLDPGQVEKLLAQCARCLKPGGVAVLSSAFVENARSETVQKVLDNPFHVHVYATGEMLNLCGNAFSKKYFIFPFLFIARK